MGSSRLVQIIALLLVPVFLLIPAFLTRPLDDQREWTKAFGGAEAALPPEMIVPSVALATFRGLAIDMLWHRADVMQQEGKFYDADTLSEWITNLQPRFPEVWRFRAWNMAFNISVMTHTPQERWDWVKKGIELLRDKGIPANPQSATLYHELVWLYYFKIAGTADDMNRYYKRALAREWQEILGEPTVGATTREAIDEFRRVAEAPDTLEELLQEHPSVQKVLDRLAEASFSPDDKLVVSVGVMEMGDMSPIARMMGRKPGDLQDPRARALAELIVDEQVGEDFDLLLNHLRKRMIRYTYHMNPERMLELMEQFGPLDWRHAAAHSLYWTNLAIAVARKKEGQKDIQMLNVYRSSIHSLQMLSYQGKIYFDPLTNEYDLMPDPRFFPMYERAMNESLEFMHSVEGWDTGGGGSFRTGHENFLVNLCVFSYLYGDKDESRRYFEQAKLNYEASTHPDRARRYKLPMEDFIKGELPEVLTNQQNARQYIDSLIVEGMRRGLAMSNFEIYETHRNFARAAHIDWTRGRKKDEATPPEERLMLLPFQQVEAVSYIQFMRNPRADILMRYRIWYNTPVALQQMTYDQIRPYIQAQAEQMSIDPDKLLPEPPGMKAYREANPQVLPKSAIDEINPAEGEGATIMRR